jgi:hypothetical protein
LHGQRRGREKHFALHADSPRRHNLSCHAFFGADDRQFHGAYSLGTIVADMRQPAAQSGTTSCPQLTRFDVSAPGSINRQWSTSLGTNPVTILTTNQTPAGQLNEIEAVIQASLAAWTGVSGTSLTPTSLATLQRQPNAQACSSSDGLNSICLNQPDAGFTFDVLVRPGNSTTTFATPTALSANPNAYDLESILTHELGHSFGFGHSGVWNAMMFPFAPAPGNFTGVRPTAQTPDAALGDDDRTGLRVLHPSAGDAVHIGSISGHVVPVNPLNLPISPPGVTGIFPAQVVALDGTTGAVVSAVMAGWSCTDPGPAKFDGSYVLKKLAVGSTQTYEIYAESLDGPVTLGNVIYDLTSICRNAKSDPGWPAQYSCVAPAPAAPFAARIRTGP